MKNKNNTIKIVISWLFVIIWACFIFYMSSRTADDSTMQSQGLISSFTGLIGVVIEDEDTMTFIDGIVRESAHGVEYFVFGIITFNALYITLNYRKQEGKLLTAETGIECGDKYRSFNCVLCAFIICCLYAISDEIHQIPVPGRTFQLLDLIIDFAGSIIGILLLAAFYSLANRKKRLKIKKEVF